MNEEFDVVFEQLNMLSKMFDTECVSKPLPEDEFSPEAYLKKGERILSLMREKTRRSMNDAVLSTIPYKRYLTQSTDTERISYARKCLEKFLRKKCMELVGQDELDLNILMNIFDKDIRPYITFKMHTADYEYELMNSFFRSKSISPVVATLSIGDKNYLTAFNGKLTKKQHGRQWYMRRAGTAGLRTCIDLPMYLVSLLELSEICSYIRTMAEDEQAENRVWARLVTMWDETVSKKLKNGCLYITSDVAKDKIFCQWCEKYKVPFYQANALQGAMMLSELLPLYLLYGQIGKFMVCGEYNAHQREELFLLVYHEYVRDVQTKEFIRNIAKERASVWTTKKNIPDKTVKAMSESKFNDYFGYVEFDEDCDLSKMEEIEKEFHALVTTYFKCGKQEDVALRFRKLGNYKAAGLYFPDIHCLCVDLRFPSSMCHEYFHMMDFVQGSLSRMNSFSECESCYTKAIEEYVNSTEEGSGIRSTWFGNTKYNKDYYLMPTEIFARCGEIYLTRIRGVKNSLCKPDGGFAYPQSDELDAAIKRYYDRLLGFEETEKCAVVQSC